MIEIVDANPNEPVKVIIYGPEGMGKSTFGAHADSPIFIPTENGASRLKDRNGKPVKLVKNIEKWDDVRNALLWLRKETHQFKTVVIDSATQLEKMAHVKIVEGTGKSIKTVDKGYGAGHAKSDAMHFELLNVLEDLRLNREMNIIITAHSQVRTVKDPSASEDYDQFEMALDKGVAGVWRQYVDCQFFVRLNTLLKTSEETKARALTDDKRVVFTSKDPAFEAKNRFAMPKKLEFNLNFWDVFSGYVSNGYSADSDVADEEVAVEKQTAENGALLSEIIQLTGKIKDEAKKKATLEYVERNAANKVALEKIRARVIEINQAEGGN